MKDNYRWVTIANADVLAPGEMMGLKMEGKYVALYNVEGVFYATSDLCSHSFAMLSTGFLEGYVVECPLHAACFDIRNGEGVGHPIYGNISTYPLRLIGDEIQLQLLL